MRKKLIWAVVTVACVTMLLVVFSYTQVRFDHNNVRIEGFYKEEKNSLDVVFIGASELYSDYSPVIAYQSYGFTGYNYSVEDNPVMFYRWELDEIFEHQTPKLVVIELSAATSDSELQPDSGYFDATLRKVTDSAPNTMNKYRLVDEFGNPQHKESYFFPLLLYHTANPSVSTAKEKIEFQKRGFSYLKGAVARTQSKPCSKEELMNIDGDNTEVRIPESQERDLSDLLDYCKQKDYNVVFTRFPHRIEDDKGYRKYCEGNYVKAMVTGEGFEFIDCEHLVEEAQIDKVSDFADGNHLRGEGTKKFTRFFGNILKQKYGINKSELSEKSLICWDLSSKYIDAFYDYYETVKDGDNDMFLYECNDLLSSIAPYLKD